MADWSGWIGRERVQNDMLNPSLAARWLGAMDRDMPNNGVMPEGIHFCLCTPEASTSRLGDDGHPSRDDATSSFLPPIPLPRRMWAASEISFQSPIAIGARIMRTSRIASISEKEGNSGPLGFVEIEHVTMADDVAAIREIQTLVYRGSAAANAPLTPPQSKNTGFAADQWSHVRTVTPNEVLLFRFSALTFNTHRIHYDAPYARNTERYRGLVVHGPLIATLLMGLIADTYGAGRIAQFNFRAISPALAGEPLHLCIGQKDDDLELGAFTSDGRQTMGASARLG